MRYEYICVLMYCSRELVIYQYNRYTEYTKNIHIDYMYASSPALLCGLLRCCLRCFLVYMVRVRFVLFYALCIMHYVLYHPNKYEHTVVPRRTYVLYTVHCPHVRTVHTYCPHVLVPRSTRI